MDRNRKMQQDWRRRAVDIDESPSSGEGDLKRPPRESFEDIFQRKMSEGGDSAGGIGDGSLSGVETAPAAEIRAFNDGIIRKMQEDAARRDNGPGPKELRTSPDETPRSGGGDPKRPARKSFKDIIRRKINKGAKKEAADPDKSIDVRPPHRGGSAAVAKILALNDRINRKMQESLTRQASDSEPEELRTALNEPPSSGEGDTKQPARELSEDVIQSNFNEGEKKEPADLNKDIGVGTPRRGESGRVAKILAFNDKVNRKTQEDLTRQASNGKSKELRSELSEPPSLGGDDPKPPAREIFEDVIQSNFNEGEKKEAADLDKGIGLGTHRRGESARVAKILSFNDRINRKMKEDLTRQASNSESKELRSAFNEPPSSDGGDPKQPARELLENVIQNKINEGEEKEAAGLDKGIGVLTPRRRESARVAKILAFNDRINRKMQRQASDGESKELRSALNEPPSSGGGDPKQPGREPFEDVIQSKINEGEKKEPADLDKGIGVGTPRRGESARLAKILAFNDRINRKIKEDLTWQASGGESKELRSALSEPPSSGGGDPKQPVRELFEDVIKTKINKGEKKEAADLDKGIGVGTPRRGESARVAKILAFNDRINRKMQEDMTRQASDSESKELHSALNEAPSSGGGDLMWPAKELIEDVIQIRINEGKRKEAADLDKGIGVGIPRRREPARVAKILAFNDRINRKMQEGLTRQASDGESIELRSALNDPQNSGGRDSKQPVSELFEDVIQSNFIEVEKKEAADVDKAIGVGTLRRGESARVAKMLAFNDRINRKMQRQANDGKSKELRPALSDPPSSGGGGPKEPARESIVDVTQRKINVGEKKEAADLDNGIAFGTPRRGESLRVAKILAFNDRINRKMQKDLMWQANGGESNELRSALNEPPSAGEGDTKQPARELFQDVVQNKINEGEKKEAADLDSDMVTLRIGESARVDKILAFNDRINRKMQEDLTGQARVDESKELRSPLNEPPNTGEGDPRQPVSEMLKDAIQSKINTWKEKKAVDLDERIGVSTFRRGESARVAKILAFNDRLNGKMQENLTRQASDSESKELCSTLNEPPISGGSVSKQPAGGLFVIQSKINEGEKKEAADLDKGIGFSAPCRRESARVAKILAFNNRINGKMQEDLNQQASDGESKELHSALNDPPSAGEGETKQPVRVLFEDVIRSKIIGGENKEAVDLENGMGTSCRGESGRVAFNDSINRKMQECLTRQTSDGKSNLRSALNEPPNSGGGDPKQPAREMFEDVIRRKIKKGEKKEAADLDEGIGVGSLRRGESARVAKILAFNDWINKKMQEDLMGQASDGESKELRSAISEPPSSGGGVSKQPPSSGAGVSKHPAGELFVIQNKINAREKKDPAVLGKGILVRTPCRGEPGRVAKILAFNDRINRKMREDLTRQASESELKELSSALNEPPSASEGHVKQPARELFEDHIQKKINEGEKKEAPDVDKGISVGAPHSGGSARVAKILTFNHSISRIMEENLMRQRQRRRDQRTALHTQ